MRGSYRSRTIDSIVREAHGLAARGVRELLLISQDTSFYGIDRGERGSLARLLRELNKVEGLDWIRLLYLYPTTITDDVLEAMAECEKVCRYVDLPLQHASAAMLKRMRRPGNRAAYDKLLARIRGRVPGVTLRTTFIVGFPGETETDFAELEAFVEETQFDHVGVFTYSHEEGTRAFALTDDVPARVKRKRRDGLMARQRRIVAAAQASRTGSEIGVMIDGPSPEHELVLQGRTEGQAPDIDAVVYLTDCDPAAYRPGELIRAQIVDARDYDLVAAPSGSQSPAVADAQLRQLHEPAGARSKRRPPPAIFLIRFMGGQLRGKTRVGSCPLFVFQGRFTAQTERLERVRAVASRGRVAGSYGLEIFDVQLRRESIGTGAAGDHRSPGQGSAGAAGGRGRHRGVPAGQPGPECAARRRRGRAR